MRVVIPIVAAKITKAVKLSVSSTSTVYLLSGPFFLSCKLIFVHFVGPSRIGKVKRVTKETNVHVKIKLDGTGVAECSTEIPFLDHMLDVSIACLYVISN